MFDPVAAIIATAALVVSLASFYLTALKRAEIEIDVIRSGTGLEPGGFVNLAPDTRFVTVVVLVSNGGAAGGVLERLRLSDYFDYVGEAPKLWLGLDQRQLHDGPTRYHGFIDLPQAFEAGDA